MLYKNLLKALLAFILVRNLVASDVSIIKFSKNNRSGNLQTSQSSKSEFKVVLRNTQAEIHKDVNGYSIMDFEGFMESYQVGEPKLPYKSFLFVGESHEFNILVKKMGKSHNLALKLRPSQELPCRCQNSAIKPFVINKASYLNSSYYTKSFLGRYRGVPVTKINFYSARYSNNLLEVNEQLVFSVKNNKRNVKRFDTKAYDSVEQNNRILIIARKSHKKSVEKLSHYKESTGFKTKVLYISNFDNDSDIIRKKIANLYQTSKFTYAIIVGHEEMLATNYAQTTYDNNTPSDLDYFLLDTKSSQEEDVIPDVLYSRIPIETNEELIDYINKLKEYESIPSYSSQVLGIASNEGSDPTDEEYMKQMLLPFEVNNFKATYLFQNNKNSTVKNINKAFNNGLDWVNYIGHGSGHAWPSIYKDEYTSGDVSLIRPNINKPIIIDVACQNGRFTYENRLGEKFIGNSKPKLNGAIAYYGGSVDISWHPPAMMAVGINKHLFRKNRSTNILGQSILAGQIHLLENFDDINAAKENLVWYHLLGDPSLKLKF